LLSLRLAAEVELHDAVSMKTATGSHRIRHPFFKGAASCFEVQSGILQGDCGQGYIIRVVVDVIHRAREIAARRVQPNVQCNPSA
jgi:hypothetical protein